MGENQQASCEQMCCKHILIVDDDPLLGNLLLEALQEEAYEVLHVLSGEMAQIALQTNVPALVLLDYHLPGMNGLELVDWLGNQAVYDHIPILLMSADMPQEVNGNKHLGVPQKTFALETLLHLVAELLA